MRAVILIENEQQDQEVVGPRYCLECLGWEVKYAGPESWVNFVAVGKHGIRFKPTEAFHDLKADDWDAVVIPGGWGAERLRMDRHVLEFVRAMHVAGKIVAAICHGPWVLCSAGLLRGVRATCYKGMADDLRNAGAEYVEALVAVDGNIITSPHYDFVPQFSKAIHDLQAVRQAIK